MSLLAPLSSSFADVTDLFAHSELEGFPIDRPYTITRAALSTNSQRRELNELGVWTLSSARLGSGVEQLLDGNLNTFWQSDGTQPHSLTVQFPRKTWVSELCMQVDFKADESYTPSRVAVSVGNSPHDLIEVQSVDLLEPIGWFNFALGQSSGGSFQPVKTHVVQLSILQNQHNGRDTHIRQVKLFGPRPELSVGIPVFQAQSFNKFAVLH
jgi:anaphase-promoting complex subunit 10